MCLGKCLIDVLGEYLLNLVTMAMLLRLHALHVSGRVAHAPPLDARQQHLLPRHCQ